MLFNFLDNLDTRYNNCHNNINNKYSYNNMCYHWKIKYSVILIMYYKYNLGNVL